MSPSTFISTFDRLLTCINDALSLCRDIHHNQRFSAIPTKLNSLEKYLQASYTTLKSNHQALRYQLGVNLDIGEFSARKELTALINDINVKLIDKLTPLAAGDRTNRKNPGFGIMHEEYTQIDMAITACLDDLAARLSLEQIDPEEERLREIVSISRRELEEWQHWRARCWTEGLNGEGTRFWINEGHSQRTWIRPRNDFIRSLKM